MASLQKGRIVQGSCWSCRRRRVKCDLLKPTCTRCQSNRSQCDYGPLAPIKWVGGTALRGRNAPSRSIDLRGDELQIRANDIGLVVEPTTLPLDTEALLLYFSNAVMPRFLLGEDTLPLDLEALTKDECLQQAILAVAGAHHDTYSHATSNDSLVRRRRARHGAIQLLRQRLEDGSNIASKAHQLFPVSVLLCILDGMIEPSEQVNASVYHLKGGYALIQGNANVPALMSGELQVHLLSVFATMDLVHALLSGEKPYFDPFIWYMFSDTQAWFGRLQNNDRFLALLKTLSEMASLGHIVASRLPSNDGLQVVEKCLAIFESTILSHFQDETPMTPSSGLWERFCDLYELGAMIYMLRALRNLPIDHKLVQSATTKGIQKLINEPPTGMSHCVILPILVIGAHAIQTEEQQTILQTISPSKDYLSFGNLQVMTDALKTMWSDRSRDMHANWWHCFQPVSGKVFLF